MSSPAGVGNAGMRVEDLGEVGLGLVDHLLQFSDLAHLLECKNLIFLIAVYR